MRLLPHTFSSRALAWMIIIALSLIWGSSFIILKKALDVYRVDQLVAGRMFFATLALFPFAIQSLKAIPRHRWLTLIVFALLANIGVSSMYALAQSKIDSALNGIINTLTPLMTLLVGIFCYRQTLRPLQMMGLMVGFVGTLWLLWESGQGAINTISAFVIFAILATVLNGFVGNMLKFNLAGISAMSISSIAFLITFPLAAFYVWGSGFFSLAATHPEGFQALGFVILLGVFANALALVLISRLVQLSDPVFASLTTYLIPLVAVFWGLQDGEEISFLQLGAMVVILLSVYIVNLGADKSE